MSDFLHRTLATGFFRTYYKVENEFVAVGTFFVDRSMYYTAAHPTKGLWMSGKMANNEISPIGFIEWTKINRIVVDIDGGNVFVVPCDFNSAFRNMSRSFRRIYKKAWTHKMSDTGEMAFILPLDLWGGNIIPYLEENVNVTYQREQVHVSFWGQFFYVIFMILFIGALLAKIFNIRF